MNPLIKKAEYAVMGALPARAEAISKVILLHIIACIHSKKKKKK